MLKITWNVKSGKKFLGYKYKMAKLWKRSRQANVKRKMKKNYRKNKAAVKNNYHFKRMAQQIQIRHVAGDSGDYWRITDGGSQLYSTYASGTSWGSSVIVGSYTNGFAMVNRLNCLENPSDFTNLFDRYKLNGVKVTFLNQVSEATAGGAQVLPLLTYAIDYDDLNPPTESQMRQKQYTKRKVLSANRPVSIFYKPKRLMPAADPSSGTGLTNSVITNAGWTNCDFPQVTHGGLKFYLSNLYGGTPATTTVQSQIDIVVQYYFSCKDPQ